MKNVALAVAVAISALVGGAASVHAQSVPVLVQIGYNGEDGKARIKFRVNISDEDPISVCRLRLMGGVSYGDSTTFVAKKRLIERRLRLTNNKARFTLIADDLDGVENNESNELPILSVQARLTCGSLTVNQYSDARARYVNCGSSGIDQPATDFLSELATKLKAAAGPFA